MVVVFPEAGPETVRTVEERWAEAACSVCSGGIWKSFGTCRNDGAFLPCFRHFINPVAFIAEKIARGTEPAACHYRGGRLWSIRKNPFDYG